MLLSSLQPAPGPAWLGNGNHLPNQGLLQERRTGLFHLLLQLLALKYKPLKDNCGLQNFGGNFACFFPQSCVCFLQLAARAKHGEKQF